MIHKNFIDNKYYKLYVKIIQHARANPPIDTKEIHHIIPKSFGGDNSDANLVALTPKQHFILHHLLTKFCQGSGYSKMVCAFHFMSNIVRNNKKVRITSIVYDTIKQKHSEDLRDDNLYTFIHPEFGTKICTRYVLSTEFGLTCMGLTDIIKGRQKSHRGWCLNVLDIPKNDTWCLMNSTILLEHIDGSLFSGTVFDFKKNHEITSAEFRNIYLKRIQQNGWQMTETQVSKFWDIVSDVSNGTNATLNQYFNIKTGKSLKCTQYDFLKLVPEMSDPEAIRIKKDHSLVSKNWRCYEGETKPSVLINWSDEIFKFLHVNNKEFCGTPKQFSLVSGLDLGTIRSIAKNNRVRKGWCINYDYVSPRDTWCILNAKVAIQHVSGTRYVGTLMDFKTKFPDMKSEQELYTIRREIRGWSLSTTQPSVFWDIVYDYDYGEVRTYVHQKSNDVFTGTAKKFMQKYKNLKNDNVNRMQKNPAMISKGWMCIERTEK